MRFLKTLPVLLMLLAAGCSAERCRQPVPELETPSAWAAAGGAGSVADGWVESFGDERLANIVREVVANNYDLKAAAARIELAASQARIAGADLDPSASLGLNKNRRSVKVPTMRGSTESLITDSYGLSLDISWELDIWDRLKAQRDSAVYELKATVLDREAAEHSLAAQSAKAYFALIEAAAQLELSVEKAESHRKTLDLLDGRYAAGIAVSDEVRGARAALAGAEAAVAMRKRALDATARSLEVLSGAYPSGEMSGGLELPEVPGMPGAGLPAELIGRRPDLAAAGERLRKAAADIDAAEAALYPALRLTTSVGYATEHFRDLLDSDFSTWAFAANLLKPLMQGDRLRANLSAREAGYKAAVESFCGRMLFAFGEVERALAAEEFLSRYEERTNETFNETLALAELARTRYGKGLVGLPAVLEAERRLIDAGGARLTARLNRLTNRIDLHLALGGPFDAGETDTADSAAAGE